MRARTDVVLEQGKAAAAARAALERQGLTLPTKPRYKGVDGPPKLPLRLAELDDPELMRLFVALTRWTDYIGGQVALAEIDVREIEAVLTQAEATVLISNWTGAKEDRVAIARAERDVDETVVDFRTKLDVAVAYKKLMGTVYDSAERDAAVVSRELTRRVGREPHDRRADRWGGGR